MAKLLYLPIPKPPRTERTLVSIASGERKRIAYLEHEGSTGEAQQAIA